MANLVEHKLSLLTDHIRRKALRFSALPRYLKQFNLSTRRTLRTQGCAG